MGQRAFIIALMASLCVALPTTDLVVPEAKGAGTSGAQFVQSTLKSGGTETQCRTFATETISTINSVITSQQGVLAAIDTGAGCSQQGQSLVATATTNKANADAVVVTKTQAVTDATATQATACNAPVTMVVNLSTLTASKCYDHTQEADFLSVQGACDATKTALSQANTALGDAQTTATDAKTAFDDAVAEAARLTSECHCRVQQERAEGWTAAGTATASFVADWKQAKEILCALDQTSTCTVPTCPAVTQPAAANGVDAENCSVPVPGGAFSYASNGATCSTACGQAGSDIVKYNCAKNDATVVDTANCVGLNVPIDYTETCAATAACGVSYKLTQKSTKGYCNDWIMLPGARGYPPRLDVSVDYLQECAKRCTDAADANAAYSKKAFYVIDSNKRCGCSQSSAHLGQLPKGSRHVRLHSSAIGTDCSTVDPDSTLTSYKMEASGN